MQEAVNARDVALLSYLHLSGQRGGEGARLRWRDLDPSPLDVFAQSVGTDGDCYFDALSEDIDAPSEMCTVYPNGTKTHQRRAAGSFRLDAEESGLSGQLITLLKAYQRVGYDPTPDEPVFARCNRKRSGFDSVPCTSSLVTNITRRCLPIAGIVGKATVSSHSYRRGRMLQNQADGISVAETCSLTLCSEQNYNSYVNVTRVDRQTLADAASAGVCDVERL